MVSIDWSKKVVNLDALGEVDKELWIEIEPILHELLDELRSQNKIETVFPKSKLDYLRACIQKMDDLSRLHNFLVHLTDSKEKSAAFLKANVELGFDESKIVTSYVNSMLTMSVLSTELFKLLLLFHLKGVDPMVSRFPITMKEAAPNSWPKLERYIDRSFRNALSHGGYAIINQKIVLFDNAKLQPTEQLELWECMMRAKRQGVLFQCLFTALRDRGELGFFHT